MKRNVFNPLTWNSEQKKDFGVGILLTAWVVAMYLFISIFN